MPFLFFDHSRMTSMEAKQQDGKEANRSVFKSDCVAHPFCLLIDLLCVKVFHKFSLHHSQDKLLMDIHTLEFQKEILIGLKQVGQHRASV